MKQQLHSTIVRFHFSIICVLLATLAPLVVVAQNEIDLTSLLNEMIDREQLTRFPETKYRLLQASSYNRESVSPDKPGWFADSDGLGFIRTEERNGKTEWVIMEDNGPGVITKIWAVCFYYGLDNTKGTDIHIYLDGETSPSISTNFFELVQGMDFVEPPFAEPSVRAGNLYFPIPYAKSCKITMGDKVFYNSIAYRKYPENTIIRTFSMKEYEQLSDLRKKVRGILLSPPEPEGRKEERFGLLEPGKSLDMDFENGAISQLEIKVDSTGNLPQILRSLVLKGEFDGINTLWVPVGDFFSNVGKSRSYQMWERTVRSDGTMVCRWLMPFKENAKISLENFGETNVGVTLKVFLEDYQWERDSMHFYATWRADDPTPTFPLYDWNFLQANGKGVIVGDSWSVLNPIEGWWGEGDEKIYVDADLQEHFPSHFGTGTEDYYGWAGGLVPTPEDEFSKPFLGNIIVGDPNSKGYNVCTRTRSLDAIPFQEGIRFDMESSSGKRSKSHFLQYAQTTFWYGVPGVSHNRPPLPQKAKAPLPKIEDLQELMANEMKERYLVEDAIEAEEMFLAARSGGVEENYAQIPVWGELSNGALKNLWFSGKGDFVDFKITEQFEPARIRINAAIGPKAGNFMIYVNGKPKRKQQLYSEHQGTTSPYIDLGICDPEDSSFLIRFEYSGSEDLDETLDKRALGVDFFLIDNNFFKR